VDLAGGRNGTNSGELKMAKRRTATKNQPYSLSAKITLVSGKNPHRAKTHDFAKYAKLKNGMTVEKALAAGVDRGYLRYGVGREILSIG
jgi:hypothetical protein